MPILYHPTIPYQRGVRLVIKRDVLELYSEKLGPSSAGRVFIQQGAGYPYPEIIDYGDFAGSATWKHLGRGSPVPVGQRDVPTLVVSGVGVPALVPGTDWKPETRVPPAIDRRDSTPTVESVPGREAEVTEVNGTWDDFLWHIKMFPAVAVVHTATGTIWQPGTPVPSAPATTTTAPVVTTTSTDSEAPMDLGQLITDLGTTYIQTKYAPTTTAPAVTVQPALDPFGLGGDIIDYFTAPDGTVVPVKKKKKCRRRRRRLATKSDLGDLAALKAILGNGEAFKAWIATHSR